MKTKKKKRKPEVPMLPDGCGYMGYEFGAGYIDSQCFGGRLYDLDDCDEYQNLYEPAEHLDCPNCQTEAWLERQAEEIRQGIHGFDKSSLPQWKAACRFILRTNREAALALLNGRFKTVTYIELTEDRRDCNERTWTFDEDDLEFEKTN